MNLDNDEMVIWEEVLRAFRDAPDIEFAYNTLRVYKNGEKSV